MNSEAKIKIELKIEIPEEKGFELQSAIEKKIFEFEEEVDGFIKKIYITTEKDFRGEGKNK